MAKKNCNPPCNPSSTQHSCTSEDLCDFSVPLKCVLTENNMFLNIGEGTETNLLQLLRSLDSKVKSLEQTIIELTLKINTDV